jgi:hypothetical protein
MMLTRSGEGGEVGKKDMRGGRDDAKKDMGGKG